MPRPNVFAHADGSFSAPLCKIGEAVIYHELFNHKSVYVDPTEHCGAMGCTCQNEALVQRRATEAEKNTFYVTVQQFAVTY